MLRIAMTLAHGSLQDGDLYRAMLRRSSVSDLPRIASGRGWRGLRLGGGGRYASAVGDAEMPTVAEIRGLRALDVSWSRVTDAGVAALRAAKTLEYLDVSNCQNVSARGVSELTNLRWLEAARTYVGSVFDVPNLWPLRKLRGLNIRNSWTANPREIALRSPGAGADFDSFLQASIVAYAPGPMGAYLGHLPQSPLRLLNIAGLDFDAGTGLRLLPPTLHVLNMSCTDSTNDRTLVALGQLPHLTELNLSRTQVTDDGLELFLRERPHLRRTLRRVDLSFTKVGDRTLRLLAGSRIEQLALEGTSVTDAVVHLLRDIPRLVAVGIGGMNEASPDALDQIRRRFSDRPGFASPVAE